MQTDGEQRTNERYRARSGLQCVPRDKRLDLDEEMHVFKNNCTKSVPRSSDVGYGTCRENKNVLEMIRLRSIG